MSEELAQPDVRGEEDGAAAAQSPAGALHRRALLGALALGVATAATGLARRLTAATVTATAGPLVPIDLRPEMAARLEASLAARRIALADGDDGLAEVALQPPGLLPVDQAARVRRAPPPLGQRFAGEPAHVAIVIDDLGLKRRESLRAAALPAPVSLAWLPYADDVAAQASAGLARGHEQLVHLPMQPSAARADPGPEALLTTLSPAELARRLTWNLSRFSGYAGVNNHMGSAFTGDRAVLTPVLRRLAADRLFFLDSRTTAHSVARDVAAEIGLAYAERDVFLDNATSADYLALQLARLEAAARRFGTAIAIGHPHEATLEALAQWLPGARGRGLRLTTVADIIRLRATPLWRLARVAAANG